MREDVLNIILKAYKEKVKVTLPKIDSLQEAYEIQNALVEKLGGRKIGYKLGLTKEEVLKKLNLSEPVIGVLLDFMDKTKKGVDMENAVNPLLELEVVAKRVRNTWRYFLGFEIPDEKISNSDPYSLVANNVNAWGFVIGEEEVNKEEVNECELYKDDNLLGRGKVNLKYLPWLENKVKIDDGMIVFTGAIVGPVNLSKGKYEGRCGKYKISLSL